MGSDPINFRGIKSPCSVVNRGIRRCCEIYGGDSVKTSARKMTAHRTGHGRVPRVYAMTGIIQFMDYSSSSFAEMPGLVMAWVSRILSMFSWVRMPFWRMRSFTEAPVRIASFAMSAACS